MPPLAGKGKGLGAVTHPKFHAAMDVFQKPVIEILTPANLYGQ
jgi:hypothetical protein